MLNPARQLTELVRLLEERGYIFTADPQPITETLRHAEGDAESKINRRAEMIDSDHKLRDALTHVRQVGQGLLWGLTLLCLVMGFGSGLGLLNQSGLNFFIVLASVLGLNTVMFGVWVVMLLLPKHKQTWFSPSWWIRGKDPVSQAILRLYLEAWQQPKARWAAGKISHRFWLATLGGMLIAMLLLLVVRQYTFNWESTLLSDNSFIRVVQGLAWLPELLGFPVPDTQAILNSRLHNHMASARQWSGLLIGSMVVYGMVPRALAWAYCHWQTRAAAQPLPLDKPYYQHLIQQWQTRVIDADTQTETVTIVPKISLSDDGQKWAVMLERPWAEAHWYRHVLGQDWLDKGTADSRDAVAQLLEQLQQHRVQLLIGVPAQTVPDRGILRQISRLAEAAQSGAVVQLLWERTDPADYFNQWQSALNERHIAWLAPAHFSQQNRLSSHQS